MMQVCVLTAEVDGVEALAGRIAGLEAQLAADPGAIEVRYQLGRTYTEYADLAEDPKALDRAVTLFEAALEEQPDLVEAKAFLGNAYVMRARFAPFWQRLGWAKRGFALLDESVEESPENPSVRLIRAINASRVPGFFGRSEVADEDFQWFLAQIRLGEGALPPEIRRHALYQAGLYRLQSRDAEALRLLQMAMAEPADQPPEAQIKAALLQAQKRWGKGSGS